MFCNLQIQSKTSVGFLLKLIKSLFYSQISGKLIILDAVLKTIKQDNLLENTRQAGDVLLNGLKQLQTKFPQYLNSARGLGTFCAINCDSGAR